VSFRIDETEALILEYLRARRGQEVPRWDVIVDVAKQIQKPGSNSAECKKIVMDLCRRLIREKKIKRNKKARSLRIHEAHA
jgi:hypothetical protein